MNQTAPAHPADHAAAPAGRPTLQLFSPAGALRSVVPLRRAAKRLEQLGFEVQIDPDASARLQRFAGDDATRRAAFHRVAEAAPAVALATRGGYGCTRLLDSLDWALLGRSVERGTRWVGHSDMTAFHLALLAHTGQTSWAGPLALEHFGRSEAEGGVDEITRDVFVEAMSGELEAIGFRTQAGFDGLDTAGVLWGGNLSMVCALLGTPHLPRIDGGILFLEDVNEHPYRVERMLLQLDQAGILGAQKAVLLGSFEGWKKSPLDRGYDLRAALDHLRSRISVPILTGLPFGHQPMLVCLPVGRQVQLVVDRREALVLWGDD